MTNKFNTKKINFVKYNTVLAFSAFICLAVIMSPVFAITSVWKGSANTNWSTKENWDNGQVPGENSTPADSAIFSGVAARSNVNNLGDIILNTLKFDSDEMSYDIQNSRSGKLTIKTGIVNDSPIKQTLVNHGTLTFQPKANISSKIKPVSLGNTGVIIFQNLSSAGDANITNAGEVDFQSGATADKATIVNIGIIDFRGNDTSAATATINNAGEMVFHSLASASESTIENRGTLIFSDEGDAGKATINNYGTLIFCDNTYIFGANIINSGKLIFDGRVWAQQLTLTNNDKGIVDLSELSDEIGINSIDSEGEIILGEKELRLGALGADNVIGLISGEGGSLTKRGTGKLILTSDNTYTGMTNIEGGTLQIGNGGTTGSIADSSDILNDSSLIINRSNTLTYGGNITGSGSLTQAGTGATILTGANSYSGGTTISAGTLQIGNGGTTGAVVGTITNNALLIFNRSNDLIYDGAISGSGGLTKQGAGVLTFTADNGYKGLTTISAGTLQIGNGGTTGSIVGNIVDTTALIFNHLNNLTYGGSIQGKGTLTQKGTGTLTLTGNNPLVGDTTIEAGTLQIGNGGSTGSIAGNIVDNSALIFNRADSLIYNSVISGTGTMTKLGAGILILSGDNTYTGTTTISTGAILLGNGGTTGSIADNSNILNNSSLTFNRSNTLTYGGVISGSGSLTQAGTGISILTGTNTYSGGTTISAGTLQIGNGGTTGTIIGTLTDNSLLIFNRSNDLIYDGEINGSGGLTKQGAGVLTLTGNNSYKGLTTISAGALQIGNGSTTGSIAGSIVDNTALIFNRSNNLTYGGTIQGSGTLTQKGTGILTLTGNNALAGNTIIEAGILQIGNGGSNGSVVGNIVDNSALIFNRADSLVYNSVISGTGTVTKLGTGVLTLNGNHTYSGLTNISAGQLVLGDDNHPDAIIPGDLNISSPAILGGNGTIGSDVINNGVVTPGTTATGTLSILGNYNQTLQGEYKVEVNALGNNDLLNIAGQANLNGSLSINAINGGFLRFYDYTILNAAAGVNGSFSNVDYAGEFNQGFLKGQVTYLSDAVTLRVDYDEAAIENAVATRNQRAVANYILATDGTTAIQSLLSVITTNDQFQQAMDQISGATFANQQLELGQISRWFEDQLSDRVSAYSSSACNSCCRPLHLSPWVAAYDSHSEIKPGTVSGLKDNDHGIAVGLELPIKNCSTLGIAIGTGHFKGNAIERETAYNEGDLNQFGLYGYHVLDHWSLGASIDYGTTNHVASSRQIQGASSLVSVPGSYHAHLITEQARATYNIDYNHQILLRPFAGLINQTIYRNAFSEQGNSGFELSVDEAHYHSTRSQLGLVLESPAPTVHPFLAASWEHEMADRKAEFNTHLVPLRGSFHIVGSEIGRDTSKIKAGLIYQSKIWDIAVLYEGSFAKSWQENGGKAQIGFQL